MKQENIEPLTVVRIGKPPTPSNRHPRPIKVVLKSVREKENVLGNVRLLKNENRGICITEDYTKEERSLIKDWFKKASDLNEKEDDDLVKWCVRGSPRSKLFLQKISFR